MQTIVPAIDLHLFTRGDAKQRQQLASEVDKACREIGFLIIRNHGVAREVLEKARQASKAFFSLPKDRKLAYAPPDNRFRGYYGVGNTALAYSRDEVSPPDLFERFTIGPFDFACDDYHQQFSERFFPDNIWPDEPEEFRQALQSYYRSMEALAETLMQVFAVALNLPEDYFATSIDRHISAMSVNYYPAQPDTPATGQLRAGAHTDYGTLTIVAPTESPGCLQVLRQGEWYEVQPEPGCFVVNIGDLMAQWTNDQWVSTMHRVGNPPRELAHTDRLALIFFHQPNADARVECLPSCRSPDNPARYEPTTSGEHLVNKKAKTVRRSTD
ncbi:isopenicillin N synthase family dioxygenase [Hydrocarboniclastica marina]|uniref:2-oxoglutarate-dependent ethylene/succinate-forming enzyme n=1 Tax=Hydrocarboniclastica marina TaxID=2259620 RepID=A0A4P7XK76_9ALTE|nr:2-oxoglutarate and iron-dependent oxygenase domain-containing protein [Hydrocarboniclastica marina]MAM00117.1 2OG-Fe(II) oxygenase [Alteromonadaceae bacterium]QCF27428.1 isopenicillin N synthase family oxygenase [Hydrocarboniclastica marina]|tara:strand:+ start:766 stop:1749 length:984 start_codon:yes stop_codon:yes gene_type:complete